MRKISNARVKWPDPSAVIYSNVRVGTSMMYVCIQDIFHEGVHQEFEGPCLKGSGEVLPSGKAEKFGKFFNCLHFCPRFVIIKIFFQRGHNEDSRGGKVPKRMRNFLFQVKNM